MHTAAYLEPVRDPWGREDNLVIQVSHSTGVSGTHVPKEDLGLSSAWLLAVHVTGPGSYVPTCTPFMHNPPSFSLCPKFVWNMPYPAAILRQGLSRCRKDVRVRGGGMGASLVSLLTAAETRSNSVAKDEVMLAQT